MFAHTIPETSAKVLEAACTTRSYARISISKPHTTHPKQAHLFRLTLRLHRARVLRLIDEVDVRLHLWATNPLQTRRAL